MSELTDDPGYRRGLEDAATNLERHANERLPSGEYLRNEEMRSTLLGFAYGLRNLHVPAAQAALATYRADGTRPATIHWLRAGRAACGLPGLPGEWPPGHRWSGTLVEVTCRQCLPL